MKIPRILNSSVAVRTTCIVLVVITTIMVTAGLLQMRHVRYIVSDAVHRQASRSMDGAINVISDRVTNVETAVATASGYADMLAFDEHSCYELLERLIIYNDDIAAATLLYRENFFPSQGRYFAPTVTRGIDGYMENDEIGGPEHEFCYLETDSNWIYTNQLRSGYWCLPYMDSISTKRAMVTYSVPLYDNDYNIYAVLCADVALDWVQKIVEEAKPYSYSQVMVIGRDSQYVCHPQPGFIQTINAIKAAEEQNDTSFINLTHRMLSWQRGTDTLLQDFSLSTDNNGEQQSSSRTIVYYSPVPHVMWSVSFSIPEDKIMEEPNRLRSFMLLLLFVMLFLISITLFLVIRAQLFPMQLLAQSTREIAKGHFDVPLPAIATNDEIRHLRDSFQNMQGALARYVEELQTTTASKASMESELKVATGIQMAMLPKDYPAFPGRDDICVFGQLRAAKAVGGDLYDYYIRDEKLFFCIGDVSGKGVPASLVMAVSRVLFRTISTRETQPDRILMQMNETLAQQNESNMFVTLFIGVLDLPTGRLRYSNAGHDAPLLVGDGVGVIPCDSNIPAGVMPGWKYTVQELLIYPQSTLFLYTDGLTEAEDSSHNLFGEERMKACAVQALAHGKHAPEDIIHCMTEAVRTFVADAEQSDDLTMLGIQYTKQVRVERMRRSLTLPNDVNTIPQLAQFVDEICEELSFDMSTAMQLNLAMEEAVVNVMNYAYPVGVKGDVLIEAHANDVRLKFTITDSGAPFDPTTKEEADTTLSAEERPIGGLGILLVRKIMDSINYEYVNGQNVLTLRKKLNKETSEDS